MVIPFNGRTNDIASIFDQQALISLFENMDRALVNNPASVMGSIRSASAQDGVWRDGAAPIAFDEFCIALDPATALFPLQRWIFEQCGLLDPWNWIRPNKTLTEIILEHGKGSGKDFVASRFIAYFAYVILHIAPTGPIWRTVQEFFGLAPDVELAIVNVAPSGEHAKTVFFGQYLSRWFKHPMFAEFMPEIGTDRISFYTEEERAKSATTKNVKSAWLRLYSKHSKAAAFDGMNVLAWVMDESDDFMDTDDSPNADSVYGKLRGSAGTRFNDRWWGLVISYPRIKGGFIQRAYARAIAAMARDGVNTSTFGHFGITADINPKFDPNSNTVREDYLRDPRLARAMYMCEPMEAEEAFFTMPSKIDEAIDTNAIPCAYVKQKEIDFEVVAQERRYYVSAEVSDIVRVPGWSYYLGGDAGKNGDAFAMAVFGVDGNSNAFEWICDHCGMDPNIRSYGDYAHQEQGARVDVDKSVRCGACGSAPSKYSGWTAGYENISGWWRRSERAESALSGPDGIRSGFNVPHVHEKLLVRVKPIHKQRTNEVDKPVFFPDMQDLAHDLIVDLGVHVAGFDPWQTATITQGLARRTGMDVREVPFAGPAQYNRGRLVKYMTEAGLVTLLPDPYGVRDREWKQLQSKNGTRLDHPQGGSKDCFDAESVAIWLAVQAQGVDMTVWWS